jgi:hypothetical protein
VNCGQLQRVHGLGGLGALRSMRVEGCRELEERELGGLGAHVRAGTQQAVGGDPVLGRR